MDSNSLYYGDNLDILRHYVQDESVDLVYLDPPFNSNQTYNILFQEKTARSQLPRSKRSGIPGIGMKQRRVRMKRR